MVEALRRVPSGLWYFASYPCPDPLDHESEVIMQITMFAAEELLLNVQSNPLAAGRNSAFLLDRLVDRVQKATGVPIAVRPTLLSEPKPWEGSGMSRAVWYRCRRARQFHEQGATVEHIARTMSVDQTTVERWLAVL